MNTSLLSFYERIREFGLLRAVGWNRRRLFRLVLGEALIVSLIGAGAGIGIGIGAVAGAHARTRSSSACSIRVPRRGLRPGARLRVRHGVLGALYPAVRAAPLTPLVGAAT